jgi:hypothetical protein
MVEMQNAVGEVVAESRAVHGGDVKTKTNLMNRAEFMP